MYHRLKSQTQSCQVARAIESSRVLRGRRPGNFIQSNIAKVQAWMGPLPAGKEGVEFMTQVSPDAGEPPGRAGWSVGTPGVRAVDVDGEEYAEIDVTITKNTHACCCCEIDDDRC